MGAQLIPLGYCFELYQSWQLQSLLSIVISDLLNSFMLIEKGFLYPLLIRVESRVVGYLIQYIKQVLSQQ